VGLRPTACGKRDFSVYEHFFVASQCMWAFSQAALVFGAAANVGAAKEMARPRATAIETSFLIGVSPPKGYLTDSRGKRLSLRFVT
jgi:hypothetical protein